jgi:hypothetical protein
MTRGPAVQGLRAVLCSEPRGHADIYGGSILPPDDDGADLGVLFGIRTVSRPPAGTAPSR